jgi:hypothetical protein
MTKSLKKTTTVERQPSHFQIRQCLPVEGEWFVVEHDVAEDRWFIERVILWAIGGSPREVDHVAAIARTGIPHRSECGDSIFVKGSDKASNGMLWSDVFAKITPSELAVREFTELMKRGRSKSARRRMGG